MNNEEGILSQYDFAIKITTLPTDWKAISRRIKNRDGNRCKMCRSTKSILVHHRDEDQSNNEYSNLITRCWECHNQTPTTPIEELYEKYLTKFSQEKISSCVENKVVQYVDSQPQPMGEEKDGVVIGREFRTNGQWEKWWWEKKDKKCVECIQECKQSSQAKVLSCPSYERG